MHPREWNKQPSETSEQTVPRLRTLAVATSLAAIAGIALGASSATARSPVPIQQKIEVANVDVAHFEEPFVGEQFAGVRGMPNEPLAMLDAPIGKSKAPAAAHQQPLAGSAIVAFDGGLLVADADSGKLLRLGKGETTASAELDIGKGVSQVVVHPDGSRAYVADRKHDEIVVVDLASGLTRVDAYRTKAEPYGISLTPKGDTLLVTTVADKSLSALDLTTGTERWSLEVGPEPRGVSVSPSGDEALVTFLTTSAVARVALSGKTKPHASFVSLDPGVRNLTTNRFGGGTAKVVDPALTDEGKSFARNAFVAGYVGHGLAVIPHQLSTPHLASEDFEVESSGYGGGSGFTPPITHRLAFLDTPESESTVGTRIAMAATSVHQPRALAYDGNIDTLYVAGFGSDDIVAIADVSQSSVHAAWTRSTMSSGACGPTGLTVVEDTGEVAVWCSLSRSVVWLEGGHTDGSSTRATRQTESLTKSHLSQAAQRGRALFRSGNNAQVSTFGAMACSSCHAEVRADGLSWRLQGNNLQTPFLAGRIEGAHPFKWDGKDPTIKDSLTNTVIRLGGTGITGQQANDIAAFLETVEPPRKPTVESKAAVARGKALFASDKTGCATCHSGKLMTDQQSYDLSADLGKVDTPSLVGLAHSAPYYHDGSAATLEALLMGNGNIHGMGRISKLTDTEISDLVQYMKTL